MKRKNPPAGFAVPGGFVEVGETVESTAAREIFEETRLRLRDLRILDIFSKPTRDPRRHTASVAYVAHVVGSAEEGLTAGDDAAETLVVDPKKALGPDYQFAFDHRDIVVSYCKYMRNRGIDRC